MTRAAWMRLMSPLAIVGAAGVGLACAPDGEGDSEEPDESPQVVDLDGSYGPPVQVYGAVRGVHLRFDLGPADLVFQDAAVPLALDAPAGAATPFLPVPTPTTTFVLRPDGEAPVSTPAVPMTGAYHTLVHFGHGGAPRSLALVTDPTPAPGKVRMRLTAATPGLPYTGLVTVTGEPLAGSAYGETGAWFEIPADALQRWAIDLNGDRAPDVPLESFSLAPTDSAGRSQVIEVFAIPTGVTLPAPVSLPVPALLLVPLDAPDGITVVAPLSGS